jgi:transcription initiation factor TFIIH subunit 4
VPEVASNQFIVVESNFKVYAYTDSRLYQAILRLFIREDYRFPNLMVGMLTRESLNEAFRKKITAQ